MTTRTCVGLRTSRTRTVAPAVDLALAHVSHIALLLAVALLFVRMEIGERRMRTAVLTVVLGAVVIAGMALAHGVVLPAL